MTGLLWISVAALCALGVCIIVALVLLGRALTPPSDAAKKLRGVEPAEFSAQCHERREAVYHDLIASYGRTFSIGSVIATADPLLAARMLRSREHSLGRSIVYRMIARVMPTSDGILFQQGEAWRIRHRVLTQLFSGGNVRRYSLAMFEAAVTVLAFHAGGQPAQDAAVIAGGDAGVPPPLGATMRPGNDLLTAMRWASVRVLLGAVLGMNPESPRSRALGRALDSYARVMIEDLIAAEPAGLMAKLMAYVALWRLSWRIQQYVRDEVASQSGASEASSLMYDASDRAVIARRLAVPQSILTSTNPPADTVFRRLMGFSPAAATEYGGPAGDVRQSKAASGDGQAADATVSSAATLPSLPPPIAVLAADVNHLNGAHKAAALVATAAIVELSAPSAAELRAALVAEFVAVCGRPKFGTQLPAMLLEAAEGSAALHHIGTSTSPSCSAGWRIPDRQDIDEGRLPLLSAVWRETLRCHVVSMGVLRRVGPGGASITVSEAALRHAPESAPADGHGDNSGRGSNAAAAGRHRTSGTVAASDGSCAPVASDGSSSSPSERTATIALQEGSEVLILLHALHSDSSTWGPDAGVWRPQRWLDERGGALETAPGPFFPFLDGIRRCAGIHLAELEFAVYIYAAIVATDTRAELVTATSCASEIAAGHPDGPLPGVDPMLSVIDPTHGRVAITELPVSNSGGAPSWRLRKREDAFTCIDGRIPFTVSWSSDGAK